VPPFRQYSSQVGGEQHSSILQPWELAEQVDANGLRGFEDGASSAQSSGGVMPFPSSTPKLLAAKSQVIGAPAVGQL
jgi:hypothetical protein